MIRIYQSEINQLFNHNIVTTDGPIFRLCSIYTTIILLVFTILLTSSELITNNGKAIQCTVMQDGGDNVYGSHQLQKVIESYCWIQTTFLVSDTIDSEGRFSAPLPGIFNSLEEPEYSDNVKFYSYYQWVPFILFLQSLLCFIPKSIWKHYEQNLMMTIVMGLNIGLREKNEIDNKKRILINYLIKHLNEHSTYTYIYWLCEFLCLVSIIFQMILMDLFFDGEFRHYGFRVFDLLYLNDQHPQTRMDPFIFIFPRITKCIFRKFGPSQSIETYDAICMLPLNSANEKIFIFIWFWFGFIGALTASLVLFRLLIASFPKLRFQLLSVSNHFISVDTAKYLSHEISIGDWWIIYMLNQNVDSIIFKDVLIEYVNQHEERKLILSNIQTSL